MKFWQALFLGLTLLAALSSCARNGAKKSKDKKGADATASPLPANPSSGPGVPGQPGPPNATAAPNPQQPGTPPPGGAVPPAPNVVPTKPIELIQAVRDYCKACHAINSLGVKFIVSDNDDEVIKYIISAKTKKGDRWLEAIIKSLSWPSNTPPKDGGGYMPIGGKKYTITQKLHSPTKSDRELLLEKLRELAVKNP